MISSGPGFLFWVHEWAFLEVCAAPTIVRNLVVACVCALDWDLTCGFHQILKGVTDSRELVTTSLEAPLASASSSFINGGCGLRGQGLGMDCGASARLEK